METLYVLHLGMKDHFHCHYIIQKHMYMLILILCRLLSLSEYHIIIYIYSMLETMDSRDRCGKVFMILTFLSTAYPYIVSWDMIKI